jgi:hypothetical protein
MNDGCRLNRCTDIGDMLAGEWVPYPKPKLEVPVDRHAAFENTIRACAEALSEDPDDLLRLAQGTTPLARLTRLLLGEQRPTARVSRDQVLYKLHETLRREGLRGRALWDEVVRRNPDIQTDSARRAVGRYRKHLRDLSMPESLSEVFTLEFSIDKAVKPRGPKPKKKDRA